jgi:hypothetical protein
LPPLLLLLLLAGQAVASQHEKHCDCSPKYEGSAEHPFLSLPLVHV